MGHCGYVLGGHRMGGWLLEMKSNDLPGFVILAGVIVSELAWVFISSLWIAALVVVLVVASSSFLYLRLSAASLKIDMSTSEFIKELFKVVSVMLIFISPIICFGRMIFSKEIGNPEIVVTASILMPVILVTLVDFMRFSPSLRKLKLITSHEILDALRQLETRLNVRIDGIYLLDRGLERGEANAYQTGLRNFRVFVTERLLSAFKDEELMGVIAHEVAHAQRRHALKMLLAGLFTIAMAVTTALLVLRKTGVVDAIIMASSTAVLMDLLWLAANRRFEYEADLVAARVVGRDAMISALRKLSELSESGEHLSKLSEVQSDHPSIENRIKRLQNARI